MRLVRNLFIVLLFVNVVLPINIIRAQSPIYSNAAQGLEISPTRVELNAAKGESYIIDYKLTNVTASDLTYYNSVQDFSALDETGTPKLTLDSNSSDNISIQSWVSGLPQSVIVKAQTTLSVNLTINVPDDAEPGGHYGAIVFSGLAPELDSSGVGMNASAGLLLLIRVDGAINEQAILKEFFTAVDRSQNDFFENGPIKFVTRIENKGNVHVKPSGNIEIKDIFGSLVASLDVNKDMSNVLPNSVRRFESNWDTYWLFGYYTANLTLGYGTQGQAIISSTNFWVIPYKLIISVLAIIILLSLMLRRLIRVYNKRIIEKAKKYEDQNKKHQFKNKEE
ncbi:hypothetical protein HGB24_02595 [Candidatus Saccharibacteria bacterium]|nr:hypothetical protein [Candidatus Saccharibacteria bacterium]